MDEDLTSRVAVIMFGPMCAGKSEISKKFVEKKELIYINPDMFWDRASGVKFTRDLGDKNMSQAYGKMIYCIQSERGQSFLLDSALKRKVDRQEVTTILRDMISFYPQHNFKIIGFYVTSELKNCLKRNKIRQGYQSEETIKKYYNYFEEEIPNKSDGFDELYTIKNDEENLPDLTQYLNLF
jgi:predicted kinase